MESRTLHIPAHAARIMEALEAEGHEAFMVGGAVRDALLGRAVGDIDIASDAGADDAMRILAKAGAHVVPTGIAHGTITAVLDGEAFEVTTFRVDGDYSDSRHPDSISPARSIEEDLARRDFTINAMAYNGRRGLIDPFGGHDDLKRHLLRCVGDPETRFGEDALRILRALRFAAQLGFAIDDATEKALRKLAPTLANISRERICTEFSKTVCAPGGAAVLERYAVVIATILPDVEADAIVAGTHVLRELDDGDVPLRLAALLGDDDGCRKALESLRFSKKVVTTSTSIAQAASQDLPRTAYEEKRLLGTYGPDVCRQALDLLRARAQVSGQETAPLDAVRRDIDELVETGACCTIAGLAIDGEDLKRECGVAGPEVGARLREFLERVMRDEIPNERETLLAALRES